MADNDRTLKPETPGPFVIELETHSENLVFSFFRKGAGEASHECLRSCIVHLADLETFASKHIRSQDVIVLKTSTNSSSIAEQMERIGLTAYVVNS
jgi:NifB/MoaA-like Fe-S oxidoreductase